VVRRDVVLADRFTRRNENARRQTDSFFWFGILLLLLFAVPPPGKANRYPALNSLAMPLSSPSPALGRIEYSIFFREKTSISTTFSNGENFCFPVRSSAHTVSPLSRFEHAYSTDLSNERPVARAQKTVVAFFLLAVGLPGRLSSSPSLSRLLYCSGGPIRYCKPSSRR